MIFEGIGINFSGRHLAGRRSFELDLRRTKEAGPDFVEVCPHELGAILAGRLDGKRAHAVGELLADIGLASSVHAPHSLNLMDLDSLNLQRSALEASIRFAGIIGASVVVCHAGKREARHATRGMTTQLAAEREALREAGDIAGEFGVVLAVENSYPEPPVARGEVYAYAARPSELAGQVAAVGHPSVGACLDVGHAFVSSTLFDFDFMEECAILANFVRHVHLHDNFGVPDTGSEGRLSERLAYGIGDLHLPPGRGAIPLEALFSKADFPHRPTCCVELHPSLGPLAREAVASAREVGSKMTTASFSKAFS